MKKEIWKDIPGYNGSYQASNMGRIKSIGKYKRNKIFSNWKNNNRGYLSITLCHKNKMRSFQVHRLILMSFYGESTLQCNHKNGIKTDNRLINLEYITHSENQKHAYRIGLKNSDNHYFKLTIPQIRRIKFLKGKVEKGYWTKMAKALCVSRSAINEIIHNRNWKNI